MFQVIAATGAVKHEDIVEQVKKTFTKLSANPYTTHQLVAEKPAIFTGSEVCACDTLIDRFSFILHEIYAPVSKILDTMSDFSLNIDQVRIIDDDLPLAHFAVAFNGASWTDPDSIALMIITSMLGSWNKNAGGGQHMGYCFKLFRVLVGVSIKK